jgi:hypothetical protein
METDVNIQPAALIVRTLLTGGPTSLYSCSGSRCTLKPSYRREAFAYNREMMDAPVLCNLNVGARLISLRCQEGVSGLLFGVRHESTERRLNPKTLKERSGQPYA